MAIEKSLTTQHGIVLAEAYTKIDNYNGNKNTVTCNWSTFKDADARTSGKTLVSQGSSQFPYAAGTMGEMLPACYTHIKTLAEFTGATDV